MSMPSSQTSPSSDYTKSISICQAFRAKFLILNQNQTNFNQEYIAQPWPITFLEFTEISEAWSFHSFSSCFSKKILIDTAWNPACNTYLYRPAHIVCTFDTSYEFSFEFCKICSSFESRTQLWNGLGKFLSEKDLLNINFKRLLILI